MVTLANAARSRLCTHMDIQEALRRSSLYNPDMHKRIYARCTSAVPEAAAEPQRNARTAPSSVVTRARRKGDTELHRLRRPPPPLLPAGAGARRQDKARVVEEVSCAPVDQHWRPRRSIGYAELHLDLRAATERTHDA